MVCGYRAERPRLVVFVSRMILAEMRSSVRGEYIRFPACSGNESIQSRRLRTSKQQTGSEMSRVCGVSTKSALTGTGERTDGAVHAFSSTPTAMRFVSLLFAPLMLLVLPPSAMAQASVPGLESGMLEWGEYAGMLAVGWGAGVTGWLVTGHQAVSCLFVDMPRAWKLWRKRVLTSSLPIYKYLIGGALLLVLGTFLMDQLSGVWTHAFDVGVLAGVVVGAVHSFATARKYRNQIDFLEANQRFLNEGEVSLFTEYKKP